LCAAVGGHFDLLTYSRAVGRDHAPNRG
jgi:hypothetical protein